MGKTWNPPGTCVDCGNDAYIRMGGGSNEMVCARCFADRARVTAKKGGEPERPPAGGAKPQ